MLDPESFCGQGKYFCLGWGVTSPLDAEMLSRQGPHLSIRIGIWISPSDTIRG